MTRPQYLLLLLFAFLSSALGVTLVTLHLLNQRAETKFNTNQMKLAREQEEFNRGEMSRRVVQSIAQDLSGMALQKPEVQSLLARYGYTLKKGTPDEPK